MDREPLLEFLARFGDLAEAPDRSTLSEAQFDLLSCPGEGWALRGPAPLDVTARERLWLLTASHEPSRRGWEVLSERNTSLVWCDLATGRVEVRDAFPPPKTKRPTTAGRRSREGPPPDEDDESAGLVTFEVRALVPGFPWAAGRHAFTLIAYDQATNTVQVELTAPPEPGTEEPPPPRPGVPWSEALRLGGLARTAAELPDARLRYDRLPETPACEALGAVLTGPSEVTAGEGPVWVHGAARALAPLTQRVAPPPDELPPPDEDEPPLPVAVVPALLALRRLDERYPETVPLRLLAFAPEAPGPDEPVELTFRANLTGLLERRLEPDPYPYQLYLIVGEHVSAPLAFTVA